MTLDPDDVLRLLSRDAPATFEPGPTALTVLQSRYLLRDDNGHITETVDQLIRRVARAAAEPETQHKGDRDSMAELFRLLMVRKEFLPNTPTLMNAGRPAGQLAACFVLPVGNSTRAVSEAVRQMAAVQKTGGGTGFDFSKVHPSAGTHPSAITRPPAGSPETGLLNVSGPVTCMEAFDAATDAIKQERTRRGANMGILRVDHPDIVDFVAAKLHPERLTNFNLSVAATDDFMRAAGEGRFYPLIDPRTQEPAGQLDARKVLRLVSNLAWQVGEPGVIFVDAINRANPTPHLGPVESTNPCGELPLLPYESCNLGSINLARFVRPDRDLDWDRLAAVVWAAIRFLDNIIDANVYPLSQIRIQTLKSRKIGLGVMGFADALILLGVPYDDPQAIGWGERIMKFIASQSKKTSAWLAEKRGAFPAYRGSRLEAEGHGPVRNATTNTVAPTGTLSILAGCSASIEPLFALAFARNILEGGRFEDVHPLVQSVATRFSVWSEPLEHHIKEHGSLEGFPDLPEDFARLFLTAHQIPCSQHVNMQAAFQRHVDNSVSKTINLPRHAVPAEIEEAIQLAWRLGCKGLTVYRDKSRAGQVLQKGLPTLSAADTGTVSPLTTHAETQARTERPAGRCPDCGRPARSSFGCSICHACAWSTCL